MVNERKNLNPYSLCNYKRKLLHPATGDPGDQAEAHAARAPAPYHLIEAEDHSSGDDDDFERI